MLIAVGKPDLGCLMVVEKSVEVEQVNSYTLPFYEEVAEFDLQENLRSFCVWFLFRSWKG
jgi:hypothetical protein